MRVSSAPVTAPATAATGERAPLAKTDLLASVIVPVRNGGVDLRALLGYLDQQTIPRDRFEVLVADDGSDDGCTSGIERPDGLVRVLAGPPLNSYAARNRAVNDARTQVLAFTDADCRPEPQWLEAGLAALEDADLVAGAIHFVTPERKTVWTLVDMELFLDQERTVLRGGAVTANLFVRRDVFERTGPFDGWLTLGGDWDFVERAVKGGGRLRYEPKAVVRHPSRDEAQPLLRKILAAGRDYGKRTSRERRAPSALVLVPFVSAIRERRRQRRLFSLDRRRMQESGVRPSLWDNIRALPVIYVLVPYVGAFGQLSGWLEDRRRA